MLYFVCIFFILNVVLDFGSQQVLNISGTLFNSHGRVSMEIGNKNNLGNESF